MSKKSDVTVKLLEKIDLGFPLPEKLEDASLVEQGMYAILRRRFSPEQSRGVVIALRGAYPDWNELRVSQAQEIASHLKLSHADGVRAAREVKEYLQEVFQRSHGMSLEFLRDDSQAAQRFVSILPYIGLGTAQYLMWLASSEKELPVTQGMVRVLDRLGLAPRNSSAKKMRAAIDPLVPPDRMVDFLVRFGEVGSRWCDARKPACYACSLVDDCRYGKKAFREWQVQQKRLEAQRERDEKRRAEIAKKEEEKRQKEEAKRQREDQRLRLKRDAEDAKKRREAERVAKLEAKKKAEDDKRKQKELLARKKVEEAERKKQQAERKRLELERKAQEAAEKKAKAERKAQEAAKKKAEQLAKKQAAKAAVEKKKAAQKAAAEKKAKAAAEKKAKAAAAAAEKKAKAPAAAAAKKAKSQKTGKKPSAKKPKAKRSR